MHAACLQLDLAWEGVSANRAAVEKALAETKLPRGSLVVDPEMCETGFASAVVHDSRREGPEFASRMARLHGIHFQHGFMEQGDDGFGRNVAAIAGPEGEVLGSYRKVHPFGFGAETLAFRGGDRLALVRCGDAMVCPMICYDLRFPELWRLAALAGAEVFTIGASWPAPRAAHWRALCISRAIENQAFVVACNRVGTDPNAAYSGGSLIISPLGEILGEARDSATVLRSDLDLAALRKWRDRFPALRDMRRRFLGHVEIDPSGGSAAAR